MIQLIQYGYLETPYLSEFPYLQPAAEDGLAMQGEYQIGNEHEVALQFLGNLTKDKPVGAQFLGQMDNKERSLALQTEFDIAVEHGLLS